MRCRCGNEIRHVPEHLRDLANWLCHKCTTTAPRSAMTVDQEPPRSPFMSSADSRAAPELRAQ